MRSTDSLRHVWVVELTLGRQYGGSGSSLGAGCEGPQPPLRGCRAQAGQPVISAMLPVADAPPLILHTFVLLPGSVFEDGKARESLLK